MKKSLFISLISLLLLSNSSNAQTLMHYWHFNNFIGVGSATNPDNLVPYRADFSVIDTSLVKVIYRKLPGTSNNFTTFWDAATTGDTTNARLGQPAGSYLRLRNPSDSMALLFYIPSTGYQNIVIKYAIQRSSAGNGATVNTFDYSIDSGLTWITTGLSRDTINTSAAWRYPAAEISINNPAANNNPKLVFRIRFTGTQNTGTGGNNRIDNFTVEGNQFVPPTPVLLHYWHFNNFNSGITNAVPISNIIPYRADSSRLDTSIVKVAFQALAGTVGNARTYWDNVSPGDTTNLRYQSGTNLGLRPRNPTDSMQLVWYIPTTNHSNPVIRFASQKSSAANGAAVLRFSYSIDSGSTWITNGLSIDTFVTSVNWTSTPNISINNLAANNNPRLAFRIVFGGPGNTGTSGNSRIDNFSVDAIPTQSGGGGNPIVDNNPPVVTFNPPNNATGVSINVNPTISFNEPVRLINNAILDSNNVDTIVIFKVGSVNGVDVPFNANISSNGRVITIVPNAQLGFNKTYYIALKPNIIKDTANNVLNQTVSSSFTIEPLQTQFAPGDILPVAYRTNATATPDEIALLTFVDILPGTQINLTDAKYTTNTPAQCPGGIVWTAPSQGVPSGSTIIISTDNGTANVGTVSGATFGLSSNGDQVIVYRGSNTNPSYITALSSNAWVSSATACGGSFSMLPAGLTNYVSAFSLSQVNAYYNGPQTGTIAQLKAAILDTTNWIGAGGGTAAQQWPAYVFFGPPTVRSASVLNANTIQLVFSDDLDSTSAVDLNNYTGISNLQSATVTRNGSMADTVFLNFSQPFVSAQNYSLTVNNIKNSQNKTMFMPFTFNFTYNTVISWNNAFISVKEDTGIISVRLNLTNPSQSSVRVRLMPSPWTNADSTSDFTFSTQTLNFTGQSNSLQTINIPINNDNLREQDEYFVLSLENAVGATITGNNLLTVFIRDNDNIAPVATKAVELIHINSFDPNPTGSTTEVIAYDKGSKRLFTTSAIQNRIDIVDLSKPDSAVRVGSIDMTPYGGLTSIACYDGLFAAASPNANEQLNGSVVFFNTNGTFLKQVTVGALPDMITFTHDGKKLLTANEGQPNNAYTIDPEGSISIIDLSGGINNLTQANVKTKLFTHFNQFDSLLQLAGVRKARQSSTLSQDLEPEYITVNDNNTKAWVTLQENNSIAEIDLVNDSIIAIWPLGTKDLNLTGNGFDASDNSGVIHLSNWPVKAFYMPDAIASFKVGNDTYLITANEGDEKEYSGLNERTTVGNNNTILDPVKFPHAAWLKLPYNLGRFRITNLNGDTDKDGDYDELYTVGSRSFSIFNATTRQMVYESKGDIELITSQHPKSARIFNANHEDNAIKGRSHSKGPEPEAVCIGEINNRKFAFIGLERVGGVLVYDVTNPQQPVFVDYNNTRSLTTYAGDHGPEITLFIPANESPNGKALLLVSNEISGTVTVFEVKNNLPVSNVAFAGSSASVAENAGNVRVRIPINPSATTTGSIVIRRTNGSNVTSADYTTTPAFINDSLQLNINIGDSVIAFNINVTDDNVEESNETISFQILSTSSGFNIGSPSNFTLTIIDNDGSNLNSVNFNTDSLFIREDNTAGSIAANVVLDRPVAGGAQVRVRVIRGPGSTVNDYVTLPSAINDTITLNYNSSETSKSIIFRTFNDNEVEANERINFIISSVSPSTLSIGSNNRLTITIIDDDATGLNQQAELIKHIKVYPNPTAIGIVKFSEVVDVIVTDLNGKVLKQSNKTDELNVSEFAKGVYLIKINNSGTKKLIIE
ncbi:MAG: choice-of-anchor I family protein [Bacteroidia bacterium]